ncbi:Csu type fimbrial protein [Pantoea coffeiphila]|nr:spore coat protein U domain-containing protein [Pantoea coffeiphila]
MKMHAILRLLLASLLLLSSGLSYAACSASSSTSTFGGISAFTFASSAQTITTGSGFACTSGSLVSLLAENTVTATISSSQHPVGTSPQLYSATGASIPYSLCKDAACGTTYNVGSTITWTERSLLGLLGLFNAPDSTLPLYLRSSAGINIPAGVYTDTLLINWHYSICFLGVLGLCAYTTGDATSTITVTVTVINDCYIDSAPDVEFASAALPSEFKTVSSALSVRCTLNASYSVNLASATPTSGDWRQMVSTTGNNYLQYQLYQAGGTAWTSTNNLSQTGSGTSQTINYTATINPTQASPPAGTYSDVVTVTVTY